MKNRTKFGKENKTRRFEDEDGRQREEDERRAKETKGEGCDETIEIKRRKEEKGERGRVGPLISSERQKWMNPIGRRASCSLLSPCLRELQTHFIEICEIRKALYRSIYHRATQLIDLFSFTIKSTIDTFLCRYYSERRRGCAAVQGQTNWDWDQVARRCFRNIVNDSGTTEGGMDPNQTTFPPKVSRLKPKPFCKTGDKTVRCRSLMFLQEYNKMVEAGLTAWTQADNLPTWTQIPLCFHCGGKNVASTGKH